MKINVKAVQVAMVDAGINFTQLYEQAHVTSNTALKFARIGGDATPKTFKKIADVLGVRPSSLAILDGPEQ